MENMHFNSSTRSAAYMRQWTVSALVQIIDCRLYSRQPNILTNDGTLLIGPLETNFSEIAIKIHLFSFTKMDLKMSSAQWRSFYSRDLGGLNWVTVQSVTSYMFVKKPHAILLTFGGCNLWWGRTMSAWSYRGQVTHIYASNENHQTSACCLFIINPLCEPMYITCWLEPWDHDAFKLIKIHQYSFTKMNN